MKIVLDPGAYMPTRGHSTDAGLDIRTPVKLVVPPKGSVTVDTGVHIELPPNTAGILEPKSGLNVKKNIIGFGTIDFGYTGSIRVKLYNMGWLPVKFKPGDKIIQLVINEICIPELELADELEDTERGDNGFGSTGR